MKRRIFTTYLYGNFILILNEIAFQPLRRISTIILYYRYTVKDFLLTQCTL